MAGVDLTTTATVPPATSLTITVFEDVDGDGTAENSATQAIDDGTNTYTLSGFDAASGNDFWIEAEFDTTDITKTAELDSAALGVEPIERVETDVAVLSFIPGESENSQRGGDPFNSAVSQVFPEDFTVPLEHTPPVTLHTTPLFDNWGTGDMILSQNYPQSLDEALEEKDKKWDEHPDPGHIYKTLNRVDISFDVSEGSIDESTVSVEFTGENADTMMEAEPVNNLKDDLTGDFGEFRFTGGYRPRHYKVDTISVDGTEAVRVTTVFGGYTRVGRQALELLVDQGVSDWLFNTLDWEIKVGGVFDLPEEVLASRFSGMFSRVLDLILSSPNIYTFFEVVLTADGDRFVRMWDNSFFPEHAVFVDGMKRDIIGFPDEEGLLRELIHANFLLFLLEPHNRLTTPYHAPKNAYFDCVLHDRDCFDLPELDVVESFLRQLHIPLSDEELNHVIDVAENLLEQGHPTWTFGTDGENEFTDGQISSLLPVNPANPFDTDGGQWSHEDQNNNRVLSLKPFDTA